MSLTFTEARDEILAICHVAWIAQASPPDLYYWDIPHDPPTDTAWSRITVRYSLGRNKAIGNRIFLRGGTVTWQIFTIFGDGLSSADAFSKVAADSMQGKSTPGGVWFRNVRMREIGQDGDYFQVQVLADFEYDEVV